MKKKTRVLICGMDTASLIAACVPDGNDRGITISKEQEVPEFDCTPHLTVIKFPAEKEPVDSTDFLRNFGRRKKHWQ